MLERLYGRFWTDEEEMIHDIESETDFDVLGVFYDYANIIDRTGDDGEEVELGLIRAGSTITIKEGRI